MINNYIFHSTIIHMIIIIGILSFNIKTQHNNKKYYIDFLSSETQIMSSNSTNNENEKTLNEKIAEIKESKKPSSKTEIPKNEIKNKQIEDPDYLYKNTHMITPSMAKEKSSIIEESKLINNQISKNFSNEGIRTDTDFPYPWYITKLRGRLWDSWKSQNIFSPNAIAIVKFKIYQDGEIKDVKIEKTSGNKLFDYSVITAVNSIKRLEPLPSDFEEDYITVYVEFKSTE
ncbi:MAG: TonB family protein [Elusimicrobiales bacterium]|nr:TonB family protein [Elusimicrobiales bacterium]